MDHGPQTSDHGPRISDPGPRISDPGPRISDPGPQTTDLGLRTTDLGPRIKVGKLYFQFKAEIFESSLIRLKPSSMCQTGKFMLRP